MGIYDDIIEYSKTIAITDGERVAQHRVNLQQIQGLRDLQGDLPYPTGFGAQDETQTIAQHVIATGGTYTLDFFLADGSEFSVHQLAYDANQFVIRAAVQTEAVKVIDGYQSGDIQVTGVPGGLSAGPLTIVYSGSVGQMNHLQLEVDDKDLDGDPDGQAGQVTTILHGQPNRPAWAILKMVGAIAGQPPAYGTSKIIEPGVSNSLGWPNYPNDGLLRSLAREAAIWDGNPNVERRILNALELE